jgi:alpha-1,3-rhamnosyl/mannosyltransferase
VLEANACGTPVICSNTSSLPEVAGQAALLVDPLDVSRLTAAIEQVLIDQSLREALKRKGFENVGRFDWEDMGREILSIFEEVIGSGAGS